jgi:7 transmembrane helices usually fused to an inactive transglutaminase
VSSNPTHERSLVERSLPFVAAIIAAAVLFAGAWALFDWRDSHMIQNAKVALSDPAGRWGLSEAYLLFALPMGATVVVFVRTILGWKTFGLFTPMLLAMAYLQSGPLLGPAISMTAIAIGMVCAPLLKWLQLSRVAFLGALISIVVSGLGALAVNIDEFVLASAFPVVVTALIVERWWSTWESDGPRKALKETWMTLFVAVIIQYLVASQMLLNLWMTHPLLLPLGSAILMILLGRYKGLRLNEISRFRAARSN